VFWNSGIFKGALKPEKVAFSNILIKNMAKPKKFFSFHFHVVFTEYGMAFSGI